MQLVRLNEQYIGEDPDAPAHIVLIYSEGVDGEQISITMGDVERVNAWIDQHEPHVRCGPSFGTAGIGFWNHDEYLAFQEAFSEEEWINDIRN